MGLFLHNFLFLHSGEPTNFKIECDALDDEDIDTLAKLISEKYKFHKVAGIPQGGERLAKALEKFADPLDPRPLKYLIVDDVLSTGNSFRQFRGQLIQSEKLKKEDFIGIAIFCRRKENLPEWVDAIFTYWNKNEY